MDRFFCRIWDRSSKAYFERRIKISGKQKYIDCFFPGEILVEHKSKGKNLDDAFEQARNYLRGLRDDELPSVILVSDFEKIRLYDLENGSDFFEFSVPEFPENIDLFLFLTGRKKMEGVKEDPVNIKASKLMGEVHDRLFEIGYRGHDLEIFLVRILFCLFAEDTGIFHLKQFENFIRYKTAEDGSDLGAKLDELFEVLNTPIQNRLKILDEELAEFEYINGKLFEENIRKTAFNKQMRDQLLVCAAFDWSRISPAIFGSLFQYVMDEKKRRNLGAHYTDEYNIKKVIKPLFLHQLWDEFLELKNVKRNRIEKLKEFHQKLARLNFLDPACGCGNFLVITYKELRKLELEVLKIILEKELKQRTLFDIAEHILLDVNQFYGIEIEEFSAKIAEVSLWLTDHLCNREAAKEFGQHFARIPLKKSANIFFGNALLTDWNEVLPAEKCSYIIGNPPFYGSRNQDKEQKAEMAEIFKGIKGSGVLDYVCAWYKKAAEYIRNPHPSPLSKGEGGRIEVGFVSTNSICQGEQVGILWKHLMIDLGMKINFAHQTFKWSNEASGVAQVFVVIVGLALFDEKEKFLFEYESVKGEPMQKRVKNINGYLVEGENIFVEKRRKPICDVPEMIKGNAAIDNGNFILTKEEKVKFVSEYPHLGFLIKKFIGSDELINGYWRYCFWLADTNITNWSKNSEIRNRVQNIKEWRLKSPKKATREFAEKPYLFMENRHPKTDYLMIPVVSSENRKYIPIGFLSKDIIANYSSFILPNATLYHFGILTSAMHMAWTSFVCGRLEGRFRYSNQIVYNNFPWAENVSAEQEKNIERLAQEILEVREKYMHPKTVGASIYGAQNSEQGRDKSSPLQENKNGASLADLYDPLTMPADLLKAHKNLDTAVDKLYRKEKFENNAERVAWLFGMYGEKVEKMGK